MHWRKPIAADRKLRWGQLTLIEALIGLLLLGGMGTFAVRSMLRARLRLQTQELVEALDKFDGDKVMALVRANPKLGNTKGVFNSYTPLHFAALAGRKDVVELLLVHGADVNAEEYYGETPLHWAAQAGSTEVVGLLLAHGADVKAKDSYHMVSYSHEERGGETPLHEAAESGSKDTAQLLLAHGADPNAKDNGGHTPLYWALEIGSKDVAEVLRAHGGKE